MLPTALRPADAEVTCTPVAPAVLAALSDARARTLALVEHLSDEQLAMAHSPIMSPLAWDLAHIAAYEDLWISCRLLGMDLLRPDLAARYDAFETPRSIRGDIELLDPRGAREYMAAVRARTRDALAGAGPGDGTICEMVVRHELQHTETMRQTMALAGLLPAGEPPAPAPSLRSGDTPGGAGERSARTDGTDEWIDVPAGPFEMGACEEGFSYDNERPRHTVQLPRFQIARRPVTNASWLRFAEGGGYVRREWWSDEGWAWKEQYDITHEPLVASGEPDAPVCHVSWFEAQAFARASGGRLPSEAEWEKAAKLGGLAGRGTVWEWTSSRFGGYPGFVAHPYREYSEVFFGEDYRVLRGGSWATSERVKTLTFRNWDLPIRRQIFAGLRLARDATRDAA
jgi:gamma-glutamyl hercynylcysteine S-oxide synthase